MSSVHGRKPPELFQAVIDGNLVRVEELLSSGKMDVNVKYGSDGRTPLMHACKMQRSDIARILLRYKAKVDIADDMNRETALHTACMTGDTACVSFLLEHKANANLQTLNEQTALHQAVCGNHEAVVKLLLEYGADVNIRNKRHNSSMHWAALYGVERIAKLLMQHDPDLTLVNKEGKTPIDIAKDKGNSEMVSIFENRRPAVPELPQELSTKTNVGPLVKKNDYVTIIASRNQEHQRSTCTDMTSESSDYLEPVPSVFGTAICSTKSEYLPTGRSATPDVGGKHSSTSSEDYTDGYGVNYRNHPHPTEHEYVSRVSSQQLPSEEMCETELKRPRSPQSPRHGTTLPADSGSQDHDNTIVYLSKEIQRLQEELNKKTVSELVLQRVNSLERKVDDLAAGPYADGTTVKCLRQEFEVAHADKKTYTDQEELQKATSVQVAEMRQKLAAMDKELQHLKDNNTKPARKESNREELIKDQIHSKFQYFIDTLDPRDHVDFLFQEKVISHEDLYDLTMKDHSPQKKVRILLMLLLNKPANLWVDKFLNSLQKDATTEHLAEELKQVHF